MKLWLFTVGFLLLFLGLLMLRQYSFRSDELNCGALGNQCEVGDVCKSARCVN